MTTLISALIGFAIGYAVCMAVVTIMDRVAFRGMRE